MRLLIAALFATAAVATMQFETSSAQTPERPSNFVTSVECGGGPEAAATFVVPGATAVAATIGYTPSADYEVWIDLSLFNNNFARGTFLGAGPLTGERGKFGYLRSWSGLIPDRVHYYRLNALIDGGWRELGRGLFETPDCMVEQAMSCQNDANVAVLFEPPRSRSSDRLPAIEQWLDLTLDRSFGFAAGTFIGAGPFAPPLVGVEGARATFTWLNIRPGLRHNYRVNVLENNGNWDTQVLGGFLSLDCRALPPVVVSPPL